MWWLLVRLGEPCDRHRVSIRPHKIRLAASATICTSGVALEHTPQIEDVSSEGNRTAPKPVAGKDQVLIEVHGASLNPIDWKIRAGYLKEQLSLTMPVTLGGDVSGVDAEVGSAVSGLQAESPLA